MQSTLSVRKEAGECQERGVGLGLALTVQCSLWLPGLFPYHALNVHPFSVLKLEMTTASVGSLRVRVACP